MKIDCERDDRFNIMEQLKEDKLCKKRGIFDNRLFNRRRYSRKIK